MRVLLCDGSGLTARQVATCLGSTGHVVEVLNPRGFALTRHTRWVRRVHTVPAFGPDPFGWLEAAMAVTREGRFDVVLAVQEQVTILAREAERVRALGPGLAVPPFAALERVQDKRSAQATLAGMGLPQPATTIARTQEELLATESLPMFVKTGIGTASTGVRRVTERDELRRLTHELADAGEFDSGGVVVQQPITGPLVMVQAVFDQGQLVAWHANLRTREGSAGGASNKRSVRLPEIGDHLARLGDGLGWHGALALDAIRTAEGPYYIDVNPRIVEPGNAWRAGVDLVGALLDVSTSREPRVSTPGRPDVPTHQLLLAVVDAAGRGRLGIARELLTAGLHGGHYRGSTEELTPLRGDLRSGVLVAALGAALLADPRRARHMSAGTVANYALSAEGWRRISTRE